MYITILVHIKILTNQRFYRFDNFFDKSMCVCAYVRTYYEWIYIIYNSGLKLNILDALGQNRTKNAL